MPTYVLARTTVHDSTAFEAYKTLAGPSIRAHGGSALLKAAVVDRLEGSEPNERVAVLSFPDTATARAWFASDAYQEAVRARKGVATMTLTVLEGV